ncbi:HAD-IA family hydrolase [uncultured Winogradskyella sp.]|uniref:HAD family hydrolase n=1 Tax=uncultured Winogradskyella sp. TaxID=395353 RepID=UPI0026094AD7|nr:HAD-IA family hydrolase [uncultured Winogradskyella sp.]
MDIKVDEHTVIVFDLDDTLYNELDYLKSAYKEIAELLDPTDWKSLYSTMFSLYRNKSNVFEFLNKNYKIEIKTLVNLYRNHKPNIQLFEGVMPILEAIKSKNGKIGIITDGRSKTQRAKIDSLGILKYIDEIIISEEIGSEKPNLENYKAIEKAIFGTQYYYLADNLKKDFIVPNALGWKSIALIDNGKNIHYASSNYMDSKYRPEKFILNFNEINII